MNKIFPKRDLSLVCQDYYNFIESLVRMRLNFILGIILKYEGTRINLNTDQFIHDSIVYPIKISIDDKKRILNLFFKKYKKKDRVTIQNGKLKLPSNFRNRGNYKTTIKDATLNSIWVLKLWNRLNELLRDEINVRPGSYLDSQKTFCNNLTADELKIISEIFPYGQIFQKKQDAMFYAGSLANDLNTHVCPYCNREYITSVRTSKGEKVIGPTFDHFLSQKDYPFLKLSFYNLVPSCTTCNSRLKNQIEFDFEHFLYPFKESYEGQSRFKIGLNDDEIISKIPDGTLMQENKLFIKIDTDSKHIPKLHGTLVFNSQKGSINVFKTEKIYNDSHKDAAFEILEKFQKVPKSHIESTYKLLKAQGKSHPEIYRFYFGNYIEEEDFNKRPLARMTRDIVQQLEDIYKVGYNTK